jgi:DNA mismatch endonuclease (patch repair protein)
MFLVEVDKGRCLGILVERFFCFSENNFDLGPIVGKRSRNVVSYNMSQIRSKNTLLEEKLEEILRKTKLQYKKHYNIIGKPDFAIPTLEIALFADSHFWHGYDWDQAKKKIKTNRDFWIKKIERNMERDSEVTSALTEMRWKVIRFWEHEIANDPDGCYSKIMAAADARQRDE